MSENCLKTVSPAGNDGTKVWSERHAVGKIYQVVFKNLV